MVDGDIKCWLIIHNGYDDVNIEMKQLNLISNDINERDDIFKMDMIDSLLLWKLQYLIAKHKQDIYVIYVHYWCLSCLGGEFSFGHSDPRRYLIPVHVAALIQNCQDFNHHRSSINHRSFIKYHRSSKNHPTWISIHPFDPIPPRITFAHIFNYSSPRSPTTHADEDEKFGEFGIWRKMLI